MATNVFVCSVCGGQLVRVGSGYAGKPCPRFVTDGAGGIPEHCPGVLHLDASGKLRLTCSSCLRPVEVSSEGRCGGRCGVALTSAGGGYCPGVLLREAPEPVAPAEIKPPPAQRFQTLHEAYESLKREAGVPGAGGPADQGDVVELACPVCNVRLRGVGAAEFEGALCLASCPGGHCHGRLARAAGAPVSPPGPADPAAREVLVCSECGPRRRDFGLPSFGGGWCLAPRPDGTYCRGRLMRQEAYEALKRAGFLPGAGGVTVSPAEDAAMKTGPEEMCAGPAQGRPEAEVSPAEGNAMGTDAKGAEENGRRTPVAGSGDWRKTASPDDLIPGAWSHDGPALPPGNRAAQLVRDDCPEAECDDEDGRQRRPERTGRPAVDDGPDGDDDGPQDGSGSYDSPLQAYVARREGRSLQPSRPAAAAAGASAWWKTGLRLLLARLLPAVLLLLVGYGTARFGDTSTPRLRAQTLIQSLRHGDGWHLNLVNGWLTRDNVRVEPGLLWADVGGCPNGLRDMTHPLNDRFTLAERCEINKAAREAVQRLREADADDLLPPDLSLVTASPQR